MSSIRLKHASGNSMSLAAPGTNPASNLELKLPHTIGSANQLLKVDGSGQLGWATDNSGVSLSGSTNNTIATVTGANALQGESVLTFDGNDFQIRPAKANFIVAKSGLTVKANSDLHTSYDLIQLGAGGALASYSTATATADTQFIHNAYRSSGGAWQYRYADTAIRLRMNSPGGAFIFDSAVSGSAGATVAFSEKARLDSSGRLRIGNTTQNQYTAADDLIVGSGSGDRGITIYSGSSDSGVIAFSDGTIDTQYRSGQIIYDHSANAMVFRTNGNYTRLTLDNAGNATFAGKIYPGGNIHMPDNVGIKLGASDDLIIYHVANSHNYIASEGSSQDLFLQGKRDIYIKAGDNAGSYHTSIYCDNNGGVRLSYDNSPKFYTKSFGVQMSGDFLPATNNTYDLGSTAKGWRNVYTNDLNLSNLPSAGNDIDGTTGSWTIQEGQDDLFIINRVNGKKYKFNLMEVS